MPKKTFVRLCAALHGKAELEIVSGSQIFSLTYKSPERSSSKCEEECYEVHEEVVDFSIKQVIKLTPIEREMARSFLFEQCGDDITRIRKQQQENLSRCALLSSIPGEYEKLSEEERKELEGIYEVEIDWDAL